MLRDRPFAQVRGAAEAVGRTLAALATVRFEQFGMLGHDGRVEDPLIPTLRQGLTDAMRGWLLGGRPGERLGRDRAERVWRHIEANASLWDPLEGAPCLVHSDYNPANLLVAEENGSWVVRGVLDWEFAWAGPNVFDIGNMLRCTPDAPAFTHSKLPEGYEEAFITGFVEGGGILPPQWKRTIRLLDFLNLVSFLEDAAERPRMFDVVTQLIDHRLDTWEDL